MSDALIHKSFDCEFKADGDDPEGSFDLYAAVFSNVDRQDEIINPGAFTNLPDFVADGVILTEHNLRSLPVGLIDSAVQDAKGLRVRGRFHTTPEAQACRTVVRERMAAGKGVKCSIGYKVQDFAYEKIGAKTVCRLKAVQVFEASFVNLPANPQAGVNSAKAAHQSEVAMNEPEYTPSLIETVKGWITGLGTKKGRAISKANHAALSTFADAMKEHGAKSVDMAKGLKAAARDHDSHGQALHSLADEMHKHLKAFGPDAETDDDESDDETESKAAAMRARLKLRARS